MSKKIFKSFIALILVLTIVFTCTVSALAAPDVSSHIKVTSYDSNVNYMTEMLKCLDNGSGYAIQLGRIYEEQRNLKIRSLGNSKYKETSFFKNHTTVEDIRTAIKIYNNGWTDEDLYWLARCTNAEMGANWVPDEIQRDVASVVINNANSLGTDIKGAVFSGKYGCVYNGAIYKEPTPKVVANCKYVLEHGITLPSYVIGQSGEPWGPVYKQYYDPVLNNITYFWYLG